MGVEEGDAGDWEEGTLTRGRSWGAGHACIACQQACSEDPGSMFCSAIILLCDSD